MKFGVIGMGNMGSTILKAAIQNDYIKAYETNIYDINPEQCKKFSDVYPVTVMENNLQLIKESDFILLAVKPQYMKGLLQEIQRHVRNKRLISIAAGWTMEMLRDGLLVHDSGTQLLRVMPNTPALVGEGYTAFCEETTFNAASLKWAKGLFSCLGMVQSFPDQQQSGVCLHVYRSHGGWSGQAGAAAESGHSGGGAGCTWLGQNGSLLRGTSGAAEGQCVFSRRDNHRSGRCAGKERLPRHRYERYGRLRPAKPQVCPSL